MKIRSIKKHKVISTPEDFTSIKKVYYSDNIKIVEYQIEYSFNIISALRSNTKDVKITVLQKPPRNKANAFGAKRTTGSRFKKSLQKSRKNARKATFDQRGRSSSRIARKRSDLSSHIDNRFAGKRINKAMLPMKKQLRAVRVDQVGQKQAVIKTFVSRQDKVYKNKRKPHKAARNMLFKGGIDPARIASRRPPIVSAVENFQGTSKNLGKSSLNSKKRPSRLGKKDYFSYVNSINKVSSPTLSTESLSGASKVPMIVMAREERKVVTEKISFDEESILGKFFWIKFEVFDTRSLKLQTVVRRVDHESELGRSRAPTRRPVLKISKLQPGVNYIDITHGDRNATSVLIQYRELNPYNRMMDSHYHTLGTYTVDKRPGGNSIKHTAGTSMPIQYRAILMNDEGDLSSVFASEVFSPSPGKDYLMEISPAAIVANHEPAGIKLLGLNTPEGIAGWSIWRKNLSSQYKDYENITFASKETISSTDVVFVDTDLKQGMLYEYKFEFHHLNGSSTYTSNRVTIEAGFVDATAGTVEISSFESVPTQTSKSPGISKYSCQMKLSAKYEANATEDLFSFIAGSGAPDLYDSDLNTIKTTLKEMSHFRITKIDMTRGRIYELGIHPAGIFIDNEKTTRTPLDAGCMYKYTIELCISHPSEIFSRAPAVLLRQSTKKLRNRKRNLHAQGAKRKAFSQGRKRYSELTSATTKPAYSSKGVSSANLGTATLGSHDSVRNKLTSLFNPNYPEKFFSRFVTDSGTLSYGAAIVDNHAESIYEIGSTGVVAEAEVLIPSNFPEIDGGRVKIRKRRRKRKSHHAKDANGRRGKRAILAWTLTDGSRKTIDHFMIQADDNGFVYSIGAVHNIAKRGVYGFMDRSHQDHVGPITYYVTPVYLDYTRGTMFSLGTAEY